MNKEGKNPVAIHFDDDDSRAKALRMRDTMISKEDNQSPAICNGRPISITCIPKKYTSDPMEVLAVHTYTWGK